LSTQDVNPEKNIESYRVNISFEKCCKVVSRKSRTSSNARIQPSLGRRRRERWRSGRRSREGDRSPEGDISKKKKRMKGTNPAEGPVDSRKRFEIIDVATVSRSGPRPRRGEGWPIKKKRQDINKGKCLKKKPNTVRQEWVNLGEKKEYRLSEKQPREVKKTRLIKEKKRQKIWPPAPRRKADEEEGRVAIKAGR